MRVSAPGECGDRRGRHHDSDDSEHHHGRPVQRPWLHGQEQAGRTRGGAEHLVAQHRCPRPDVPDEDL